MSFKSTLSALALLIATPALAEIEFHDQYARSSNAMAGAAFMVIHNHGETDDHLVSVSSDVSARTELHTHRENADGVMRMVHVEEGFALPADGEIIMERGGAHVMFMGLDAPFEQGQTVSVIFTFEQAGDVVVEIPVDLERMDGHGHGHDHSHDHGDHASHSDG